MIYAYHYRSTQPCILKHQELLEKGASTQLKMPPLLDVDVFPGAKNRKWLVNGCKWWANGG